MNFADLFFTLLGLHFLADYPLQGPYLSALKNGQGDDARWLGSRPWVHGLISHSAIHGLFVGLATGSLVLGLGEAVAHALIDFAKIRKIFGATMDQLLHFVCKVWFAYLAVEVFHTHCPFLR